MQVRMFVMMLALAQPLFADITLPHILSDHAVLQRNQPIRIWGRAAAGEMITVRLHDQSLAVTADSTGGWRVKLKPEQAGGPYVLTVSGSSSPTVTRSDLLIGDVWVASGQSNMEFSLRGIAATPNSYDYPGIAHAIQPEIHLLHERHAASPTQLDDANADWTPCTPETAEPISAVAYYFAVALQAAEHVPIGIISTSWGGTPALAWVSEEDIGTDHLEEDAARQKAEVELIQSQVESKGAGQTMPNSAPPFGGSHYPSWLFNGMIAPFTQTAIKGVIWYQGETDAMLFPRDYRQIFPAVISSWRKAWHGGDFPFLFVQLPGWENGFGWGWIRDAQRRTLSIPHTAMVGTLDIGEDRLLHPPDKKDVGERLALAAEEIAYGELIEGQPPLFVRATVEGNSIRAYFAHADGLTSRGRKSLGDFEVAGEDGDFFPATARIELLGGETTVIASSPQVAAPRFIRYGWSPWVSSYLWNAAGLSMAAFSSTP
jgi:sialate O-acetylesterase